MGLFKRTSVSTTNFVTTGQTGNFITIDQTGQFGGSGIANFTGFPAFGINPHSQNSGEMILSNSYYPPGATQLSYFVCSQNTEGVNFNGNVGCCIGCFEINLRKDYAIQAWLIKNSLIGIGEDSNGNKNQHYSIDLAAFVYSSSDSCYNINGPFSTIYTKTQNCFCATMNTFQSGVVFKVFDSPNTKMKWTNKIEIIQSINEEEFNLLSTEQQILNYFNTAISPQSASTDTQVTNLNCQIPIINGGQDPGLDPINAFDGGEDV